MKKFRLIFFLVYGAFHIGLMGFSFYAVHLYESNKIRNLLKLSSSIPYTRWMAMFGMGLFLINLIIFFWIVTNKDRRIKFLEQERLEYKAKMFNLESDSNDASNPDEKDEE